MRTPEKYGSVPDLSPQGHNTADNVTARLKIKRTSNLDDNER